MSQVTPDHKVASLISLLATQETSSKKGLLAVAENGASTGKSEAVSFESQLQDSKLSQGTPVESNKRYLLEKTSEGAESIQADILSEELLGYGQVELTKGLSAIGAENIIEGASQTFASNNSALGTAPGSLTLSPVVKIPSGMAPTAGTLSINNFEQVTSGEAEELKQFFASKTAVAKQIDSKQTFAQFAGNFQSDELSRSVTESVGQKSSGTALRSAPESSLTTLAKALEVGEMKSQVVQVAAQTPSNPFESLTTQYASGIALRSHAPLSIQPKQVRFQSESKFEVTDGKGAARPLFLGQPIVTPPVANQNGAFKGISTQTLVNESGLQFNLERLLIGGSDVSANSGLTVPDFSEEYMAALKSAHVENAEGANVNNTRSSARIEFPDRFGALVRSGSNSITLKINPSHLGEAKLSITVLNEVVTATIIVDSLAAKLAVESSLDQLSQRLTSEGLTLDRLDVELSQQRYGQRETDTDSESKSGNHSRLSDLIDESGATESLMSFTGNERLYQNVNSHRVDALV